MMDVNVGESPIRIEDAAGQQIIHLTGGLTLTNAATLREMLLACLDARQASALDLTAIEEVDLAGMQLLHSARRTFAAQDVPFHLQGVPEWFWQKAQASGFIEQH